jgi:hypothetical protein
MSDDTYSAYDALLDLLDTWDGRLEVARSDAAQLLADSRSSQRSSPVADNQRRARVIEAATTASVLRVVCDELHELVDDVENRLADFGREPTRGVGRPASP